MEHKQQLNDRLPDTARTESIAQEMNDAHDKLQILDISTEEVALRTEIACAMAALSFDTLIDYSGNRGARRRLARYIAPDLDKENRRLQRDAETDKLTRLPNRNALDAALPSANRSPKSSIIVLDADNFGKINKLYGHGVGDDALKDMARKIKSAARKYGCSERVFRRGGDEFVIITPTATGEELLRHIIKFYGSRNFGPAKVSLTGALGNTFAEADEDLRVYKLQKNARGPLSLMRSLPVSLDDLR